MEQNQNPVACTGPQLSAVRRLSNITNSDNQLRHDCLCVRLSARNNCAAAAAAADAAAAAAAARTRRTFHKFWHFSKICRKIYMLRYVTSIFTSRHVILLHYIILYYNILYTQYACYMFRPHFCPSSARCITNAILVLPNALNHSTNVRCLFVRFIFKC